MLADVTFGREDINKRLPVEILNRLFPKVENSRFEQGLYRSPHWNPEYLVREKLQSLEEYPRQADWKDWFVARRLAEEALEKRYAEEFPDVEYHPVDEYGVCDYPRQVLERWPHLEKDEEKYVVFLVELNKSDQSPHGGWRWHKWGEYIGTQNPQCEYLYDEPVIEQVFTYHIYKVVQSDAND